MRATIVLAAALLIAETRGSVTAAAAASPAVDKHGHPLRAVPNAKVAATIAEAVVAGVYGEGVAVSERPYRAQLIHNVWEVDGTLQCAPMCAGGTAHVSISPIDGRVLYIFHTK